MAEYLEAIRLKPGLPEAHNGLGNALKDQGKLPDAVAEYREAIRLKPDLPEAHNNLGTILKVQGKLPEAVAEFRVAIRLNHDYHMPHYNLGNALAAQRKLSEAVAEFRVAIRLKPDYPETHCNLGHALRLQGQFEAALAAVQRGHELGTKTPGWRYPSAQWVLEAKRLVELDRRLPELLAGKTKPTNAAEQVEFAEFCGASKHKYLAAVRLYADAFQAEPNLVNDLVKGHRYNAACDAAIAAAGKDEGAKKIDDPERARLRTLALGWLRDDLAAWSKRLDGGKPANLALVAGKMRHWQQDADLAAVRDADALAKLPETERAEWLKLWQDVEALLKRTAEAK